MERSARASSGLPRALDRPPPTGEEGFSLVEVAVAMGVFALIASFVLTSLAGGLRGVLLGKRRETATQEASRMIELARSVSYDSLGLVATDPTIATDPAIVTQNGVKKYEVAPNAFEPIIFSTNTTDNPFNPHVQQIKRGATILDHYVYVTGRDADGNGTIDSKRVLVRVAWPESGNPGPANQVRTQTYVDPGGFVTVPGTASGQLTPLTAETTAQAMTFSVKSGTGLLSPVTNAVLPADPVTVVQPQTTGHTSFRATSSTMCTAQTTLLQGPTKNYGGHPVAVTADDDSQTATPDSPPDQSYNGNPPDAITGADEVDRLVSQTSLVSTDSCHTTADDQDGIAPSDDGLPYEHGTGNGPSAITLNESLVSGVGLPSTLGLVDISTASVDQLIDHQVVGGNLESAASASGSVGTSKVMVLGTTVPDGLVRVDPFTMAATARSSPGTPSQAPAVTVPGTITVWIFDPASVVQGCASRSGQYCKINVNALQGISTVDFSGSVSVNLGLTNIAFTTTVQALPPDVTPQAGRAGPNGEKYWDANYSGLKVSTAMTINVTVTPPLLPPVVVKVLDATVDLDLGSVAAHGCAGLACPAQTS